MALVSLCALALLAGCHSAAPTLFAADGGVNGDGGADTDVDADTDADGDSDGDSDEDCSDPTFGVETECALPDDPCACEHYCNQEYFEEWGYAEYYAGFYCYGRCDPTDEDYECPGADEYCVDLGVESTSGLCLPYVAVVADAWSTKLFPDDYTPTSPDYTPVDVTLYIDEEMIALDYAIGYEYHSATYGDMVLLYFVQSGMGDYHYVEVQVPLESWASGEWPMWSGSSSDYHFYPVLYFVEVDGTDYTTFVETLTVDGVLDIVDAPLAGDCTGPDCPTATGGAFQFDFLGFRAEFPPYEE